MSIVHAADAGDRRIEVWVRSFAPEADSKRDRALDRAGRLDRRTATTVAVRVWGKSIERLDGGDDSQRRDLDSLDARLASFTEWGRRNDRHIDPFFRTRRVESAVLDETYRIVRLPTVAVAEYRDGDLVHLAPCRSVDDDSVVDPIDRLDALLAGVDTGGAPAGDDESVDPDRDRPTDERRLTEHPSR